MKILIICGGVAQLTWIHYNVYGENAGNLFHTHCNMIISRVFQTFVDVPAHLQYSCIVADFVCLRPLCLTHYF